MKNIIILTLLFIGVYGWSQVDATKPREKKGRVVVGGGLGLGFNRGFNIQANPDIGYRIKGFEFGASVGIAYQKYNGTDDLYDPDFKYTLWNFGPYLLYMPIPQIYLRGQYQFYTGKWDIKSVNYQDQNYNESTLWLGGGYQDKIAEHVYYRIGFLYNVLYDENDSIFNSGFIPTIGISAGL